MGEGDLVARRVVEDGLDGGGVVLPRADGVVVDRRAGCQAQVRAVGEERGEPLHEVPDDVAGPPVRHGRGGVPAAVVAGADAAHAVAEGPGDRAVLVGRCHSAASESSARRRSSAA